MPEPLLTTAEVAEQLRQSIRFIHDEFRRGALRGSKFGGKLHFTQADVDAYIDAHRNKAPMSRRRRSRNMPREWWS